MNDALKYLDMRARLLGFASAEDVIYRLEAAEPRFVRIPSDSWSIEMTVRLAHMYPPETKRPSRTASDARTEVSGDPAQKPVSKA